jgi:hypothetical protein
MSACLLSVVIMMSEKVVSLAAVQCIIVKFLTKKKKNAKAAEILTKLRAQIGDETLSWP